MALNHQILRAVDIFTGSYRVLSNAEVPVRHFAYDSDSDSGGGADDEDGPWDSLTRSQLGRLLV